MMLAKPVKGRTDLSLICPSLLHLIGMQKLNTKVKTNLQSSNIENNETIDQEYTFSHQYKF